MMNTLSTTPPDGCANEQPAVADSSCVREGLPVHVAGRPRIAWMDAARAIAILLVLLTHATEQAGFPKWWYQSIVNSVDRLGVPLFFMLSGALVLKKCEALSIGQYYRRYGKRIVQFAFLYFFWFYVTDVVYFMAQQHSDFAEAHSRACYRLLHYGTGRAAMQLWYMPVIICWYMIAPFICRCLSVLRVSELGVLIGECLLCMFPTLWLMDWMGDMASPIANCSTALFYSVLGYALVHKINIPNNRVVFGVLLLLLIGPIVSVLILEMSRGYFIGSLHWYSSSISIAVSSGALFVLLMRYGNRLGTLKWVRSLSLCSFGIFLWHHLIIYLLMYHCVPAPETWTGALGCAVVYGVGAWLLSWVLTHFMSNMPYICKLVR